MKPRTPPCVLDVIPGRAPYAALVEAVVWSCTAVDAPTLEAALDALKAHVTTHHADALPGEASWALEGVALNAVRFLYTDISTDDAERWAARVADHLAAR